MKKNLVILVAAFAVLIACGPKKDTKLKTYRFIDHLAERGIIVSPLRNIPFSGVDDRDSYYPVRSAPMNDLGSGENPLDLKRKLSLGLVDYNILFSPPESRYEYTVDIPENAKLEFGVAVIRDVYSRKFERPETERGRGVHFQVALDVDGKKKVLFQKYLSLPEKKEYRTISFTMHSLSFPYRFKNARISFITKGQAQNFSFWINPVLYIPEKKPRNVILISLDTLRSDHLGCYGYDRNTSPSIDELSQDSALFLNTFATSPWTLPSHVSLLTALNCVNHRVYYGNQRINPSILTLADLLRSRGYFSAGLTGGGFLGSLFGFSKGFDKYQIVSQILSEDAAESICAASLEWMEKHKDRNFFLFLHTYQIHDPYYRHSGISDLFLPEGTELARIDMTEWRLKQEKRYTPMSERFRDNLIGLYDGEIRYTDEVLIRPLLQRLKELGLYDDTIIILTSDHGEEFYEHGGWHHTHSLYNETIKVPLLIKFPHSRHAGKRIENVVSIVDIMPTILDELGIQSKDQYMDGRSLKELLPPHNMDVKNRIFLSELAANVENNRVPRKMATHRDVHKLIVNDDYTPEALSYFTVPPERREKVEVFNMVEDSDEQKNLSQINPNLAADLLDLLASVAVQRREGAAQKARIDEQIKEQLRALGYVK
jgi:arylsulfatase A-like enzyme